MLSIDARIALAPEGTYRDLVVDPTPERWWQMLARPALVLLVLAVAMPIMSVRMITASLVLRSAIAWSAVVLIQMAMALVTIAFAPGRRASMIRAFDLWFAGHLPYSAWILLLPIITTRNSMLSAIDVIVITFALPSVWTTFIATAFCRVVLGTTAESARWRVAVHQALTVGTAVILGVWAAGGIDAVTSYLMRVTGRI